MVALLWTIGGSGAAYGEDLGPLARRISGGATLLGQLASSDAVRQFQEDARDFERAADRDRGRRIGRAWRRARSSYDEARRDAVRSNDGRVDFVVRHLDEDLADAERLVGRDSGRDGDDDDRDRDDRRGGDTSPDPGHASLIDTAICVGSNQVGSHPCPAPRRDATFRLPRSASRIRKIAGEWRDYGLGARAQVLVNGTVVFEADVEKDWDGDGKDLDLTLPRGGSTVTVVSKNGDPMWVRKLEVDYDSN
jgi:hypothetical protein